MTEIIIKQISKEQHIPISKIEATLKLLQEGATIPFIARYRKEVTGNLNEEQINEIYKQYEYQVQLMEKKEQVIRLIDEKKMLTEELKNQILACQKLIEVEDLYRPYKEKKKTKATEAIKKGLEPFAKWFLTFPDTNVEEEAKKYISEEVKDTKEAIQGALYIIAEYISDNAEYRKTLREMLYNHGNIVSNKKKDAEDEKGVYTIYYEYKEPVSKIKEHRVLALNRGEKEKVLTVKIDSEIDIFIKYLETKEIKDIFSTVVPYYKEAILDSFKRLIYPSIEREIRAELTERAEEQAIKIFALNLDKLLLQPPIKGKMVLGIDPGFRTGCKIAVINRQGDLEYVDKLYFHDKFFKPEQKAQSIKTLIQTVKKYQIEIIAIGNGTASRETEEFVSQIIKDAKLDCKYVIVSEAGASVYSASDIAREEFPDLQVEERSAASIARRLQDPLSELVKIDPKSIGVGQYQHDVSNKKLEQQLNFVVTQAVNSVGVDVNTASKSLLLYVSGLNSKQVDSIIKTRSKNGPFKSRQELTNVSYLGEKAFEQAAGFLRITNGTEPLDITSIHPESYEIAKKLMKMFEIDKDMLGKPEIAKIFENVSLQDLAKLLQTDIYTLEDIIKALKQPLRDPRDEYPQPILKKDILQLEDLQVGMQLQGTVRNVVDFGAFVDIGLHDDGLVHISQITKKFVKHPSEILSVGDIVSVYVLKIDKERQKISLTMIKENI